MEGNSKSGKGAPNKDGQQLARWRRDASIQLGRVSQATLARMYLKKYGYPEGVDEEVALNRLRNKIANYESGVTPPPPAFMREVADLLNIPESVRTRDGRRLDPLAFVSDDERAILSDTTGDDIVRFHSLPKDVYRELIFRSTPHPVVGVTLFYVDREGKDVFGRLSVHEGGYGLRLEGGSVIPLHGLKFKGILVGYRITSPHGILMPETHSEFLDDE